MKKYIIYTLIVISSSLLLTGCTKKETNYDDSKVKVVDSTDSNNDDTADTSQLALDDVEKPTDDTDLGYLADPSTFTKEKQTVGVSSQSNYKVVDVTDSTNSGYHRVTFQVEKIDETDIWPTVVAENALSSGVIRVTLSNMAEDNSHISYQDSQSIDKGAIAGIYHAVTSKENTAIYEIGISGDNPFKLEASELDGKWFVNLDIAYDLKYSAPTMDLGSTDFSNQEQSIEGITKEGGAKITSYSYSVSGGVLKFVYTVASGTSNPIPTVNASYDDMNILNVSFPSLDSDKVSTWGNSITLPGGIVVEVSRSGDSSSYKFGGIGGKNDFKLSASKSPNQVTVEIRL